MQESICSRAAHEGGLTPSDLQRLVDVARAAADAGGQELMRHYGACRPSKAKVASATWLPMLMSQPKASS